MATTGAISPSPVTTSRIRNDDRHELSDSTSGDDRDHHRHGKEGSQVAIIEDQQTSESSLDDEDSTISGVSSDFPKNVFPGPPRPFPPSVGFPNLVQPQKAPTRLSTPKTLAAPFLPPPPPPADKKARRLTPHLGGCNDPVHHTAPVSKPTASPPSTASESSYEEVSSSRGTESFKSTSKIIERNNWSLPANIPSTAERIIPNTGYPPSEADPLEQKWQDLEDKRVDVFALRAEIDRMREKLKQSREGKDAADNAFMALIRPMLLKGRLEPLVISAAGVEDRFRAMQATRTDYQALETALMEVEEDLDRAELQLNLLERELINELRPSVKNPVTASQTNPATIDDRGPPSSSRTSLLGIPAERPTDTHPLYDNFMSEIGYLQLAKEHHVELLYRKSLIEAEVEKLKLREQHQLWDVHARTKPIGDGDREFLRGFNLEEKNATDEVNRLEERVQELKQLCHEEGVVPKHAPFHELYTFNSDIGDDMSIDFDPYNDADSVSNLASSRFPIILSNPRHLMEQTPLTAKAALKRATKLPDNDPNKAVVFDSTAKEYHIENLVQDSKANDKSDFINRWLLQRLRTSPMEVELLYATFSSFLKILNVEQWQRDVLRYWPRDMGANLPDELFVGPVTSDSSQNRSRNSDIVGIRTTHRMDSNSGERSQSSVSPLEAFSIMT